MKKNRTNVNEQFLQDDLAQPYRTPDNNEILSSPYGKETEEYGQEHEGRAAKDEHRGNSAVHKCKTTNCPNHLKSLAEKKGKRF